MSALPLRSLAPSSFLSPHLLLSLLLYLYLTLSLSLSVTLTLTLSSLSFFSLFLPPSLP